MARWSRTPYERALMLAWEDVWTSAHFRHLTLPSGRSWDDNNDAVWVRYVASMEAACTEGSSPSLLGYYHPIERVVSVPTKRVHNPLTPSGSAGPRFTTDYRIHIALLNTPPFAFQGTLDTHKDMIRDIRPAPVQELYPCANRPLLLLDLAETLVRYECACRSVEEGSHAMARRMLVQLGGLHAVAMDILKQRRQSKTQTDKAFVHITDFYRTITPEEYAKRDQITLAHYRNSLVSSLWDIFHHHRVGQRHARAYPHQATWYAIAAILMGLGVEATQPDTDEQALETVAERLRKRRKTDPLPPIFRR
jgi:hypothetical protein